VGGVLCYVQQTKRFIILHLQQSFSSLFISNEAFSPLFISNKAFYHSSSATKLLTTLHLQQSFSLFISDKAFLISSS
jgi:hypothetical protein